MTDLAYVALALSASALLCYVLGFHHGKRVVLVAIEAASERLRATSKERIADSLRRAEELGGPRLRERLERAIAEAQR